MALARIGGFGRRQPAAVEPAAPAPPAPPIPPAAKREPNGAPGEAAEALLLMKNFEESHQGWFWSTDAEGCIRFISEALGETLGPDQAHLPGSRFADIFAQAEEDPTGRRTLSLVLLRQKAFEKINVRVAGGGGRPGTCSSAPRWAAASSAARARSGAERRQAGGRRQRRLQCVYVPDGDKAMIARVAAFLLRQDTSTACSSTTGPGRFRAPSPSAPSTSRARPARRRQQSWSRSRPSASIPTTRWVGGGDLGHGPPARPGNGSFGRADTLNTMIAFGPSFKRGFVIRAPAGNADIAVTLAKNPRPRPGEPREARRPRPLRGPGRRARPAPPRRAAWRRRHPDRSGSALGCTSRRRPASATSMPRRKRPATSPGTVGPKSSPAQSPRRAEGRGPSSVPRAGWPRGGSRILGQPTIADENAPRNRLTCQLACTGRLIRCRSS